jgi:uncharacterized membrane protein YfcA
MMSYILEPVLSPAFGLVAIAAFIGGFLRGFIGFGGALVSVPVLSVVFGPLAAVPISNVIGFPVLFQLLPAAMRDGERGIILPISIGILLATPIGCVLLVSINPNLMKIVISTLVLLMVLILARNWRLSGSVNRGILLAAGAVGGLIQGSAGIGGPPLVAVALSRPGPARNQRGNVLGAITTVSVSSILPLWYFGLFTSEVLVIGLILMPIYSGAAWIGARYFSGEGQRHYRRVALTILALIGVVTLAVAVNSYLSESQRVR